MSTVDDKDAVWWIAQRAMDYQAEAHRYRRALERLEAWVGSGWPDLDDPEERERFMRDVQAAALALHRTAPEGDTP